MTNEEINKRAVKIIYRELLKYKKQAAYCFDERGYYFIWIDGYIDTDHNYGNINLYK